MNNYVRGSVNKFLAELKFADNIGTEALYTKLGILWDKVQADVIGGLTSPTERDIYGMLISAAKDNFTGFKWQGETRAVIGQENTSLKDRILKKGEDVKKFLMIFIIELLIIAVLGVYFCPDRQNIRLYAAGAVTALVFDFLRGFLFGGNKKKTAENTEIIQYINTEAVKSALVTAAADIDLNAEKICGLIRSSAENVTAAGGNTPDGAELASAVLRCKNTSDTELPGDILAQVGIYLSKNKIEALDYEKGRENMFTLLPSNGQMTIVPALVRDGNVICKGEACVKEL